MKIIYSGYIWAVGNQHLFCCRLLIYCPRSCLLSAASKLSCSILHSDGCCEPGEAVLGGFSTFLWWLRCCPENILNNTSSFNMVNFKCYFLYTNFKRLCPLYIFQCWNQFLDSSGPDSSQSFELPCLSDITVNHFFSAVMNMNLK